MQPTAPGALDGTASVIESRPCPFLVRAWWGDQLLAESTAAVCLDAVGERPALYVPAADVRFDRLGPERHLAQCPVKGSARLWSVRDDGAGGGERGEDVAWCFTEPSSQLAWLQELVGFDHDRARVELSDSVDSSLEPTVKRFPVWGDAADLLDLLDVTPLGGGRYRSSVRGHWLRPVVEGSQLLGQALVAASREVPDRRVVSAHMVLMRAADARRPVELDLETLHRGRTFATVVVSASQARQPCATGTILLDAGAAELIRHREPPPEVVGPAASEPYDMSMTGRDVRIVDGAYSGDPDAQIGPPELDAWVRFTEAPHDVALNAALLAQFTGHLSIAAALRPHAGIGQRAAHRTLSTAINAISLSLHAEVRVDRWMLYHQRSTFAGDGMTRSECRVHNQAGELLASFAVDAMVRPFAPGRAIPDERTAL